MITSGVILLGCRGHHLQFSTGSDEPRRVIGEVDRGSTRVIDFRQGWRGHLGQGRFASFLLDWPHLLTSAQYVELNPVRAGQIDALSRYRSRGAAANVRGRDDTLVRVASLEGPAETPPPYPAPGTNARGKRRPGQPKRLSSAREARSLSRVDRRARWSPRQASA
jgi:hypothetical protein